MTGDYEDNAAPCYADLASIKTFDLFNALCQLHFLNQDLHMRSQAHNLSIVDEFLSNIEYQIRDELIVKKRARPDTSFLSIQSQMWVFAAYGLIRLWNLRTNEFISSVESGELDNKLANLKAKKNEYLRPGLEMRITQLEAAIANPGMINDLKSQLLHLHIPFTKLEYMRVVLANHKTDNKNKSTVLSSDEWRINKQCGSLDYVLENGKYSMGLISRRDIADSLRSIDITKPPPMIEDLKAFDDYMAGNEIDSKNDKHVIFRVTSKRPHSSRRKLQTHHIASLPT